jgi:hypothetical protein
MKSELEHIAPFLTRHPSCPENKMQPTILQEDDTPSENKSSTSLWIKSENLLTTALVFKDLWLRMLSEEEQAQGLLPYFCKDSQ